MVLAGLGVACSPPPPPSLPAATLSGLLQPGDVAVVKLSSINDLGIALVFDGPEPTRDAWFVPVGTTVLVVEPEDDEPPLPGDWLTIRVEAGMVRDYPEGVLDHPVVGLMERRLLGRTSPPTARPIVPASPRL